MRIIDENLHKQLLINDERTFDKGDVSGKFSHSQLHWTNQIALSVSATASPD